MNDLTIFPAQLGELSIGQLAGLPHHQLLEVEITMAQLIAWVKKARIKLDAAKEQRYGVQARKALSDSGRDFGTSHFNDG